VAVETHAKTLAEQWSLAFEDNFSGADFNSAAWSRTYQDGVQGRWCSATQDSNGSVSGGVANLTMRRADAATTLIINDKTKVWQADAKKAAIAAANKLKGKAKAKALKAAKALPTNGCPKGVFGNARVSTEGDGNFHIKTGILAAEVSFPVGQGMHGGVWLQSNSDSEIDMVEAFGYRKGIQNVLHVGKYDTPEARKWVAKSTVNKKAWWSKPHLFSMEWTRSQVTFRVDGTVTKVEKKALPDAEYYLVLSMLSSDWETPRLTKPVNGGTKAKLPASMKVNWVKAWTPVA